MTRFRRFPRGGVHPHDSKELTNGIPIRNAPVPPLAVIPMHQHMGAPAECLVQPEQTVGEGMLIGRATGPFSANVHSSIPGRVRELTEIYLPNGIRSKAAVIQFEGEFGRSGKSAAVEEWDNKGPEEFLAAIREQGIVGLGGATFPTPIKLAVREGSAVEFFVMNGVECEPFLTADHRLMLEKTDELLSGVAIIARILTPRRVLIGVEANKPDAIDALEKAVAKRGLPYEVVPLRVRYPQGDEKQLLKALTGREVPSGGLPLDIGAVVSNAGTVFAIYEAVVLNKPLVERIVTVSGAAIARPGNFKVRIGTPIRDLVEECGGFRQSPGKVIAGGPMMGFALADLDAPVTKGVSGILALTARQTAPRRETACIGCGRCVEACPFGLSPTILYKLIDHLQYAEAMAMGLMDCKECGCCGFVCPARIPLVQGMKLGKNMGRKKKA
jgi:electron transport complex protein RnfC